MSKKFRINLYPGQTQKLSTIASVQPFLSRLKDNSSSKRYVITNPKANFTLLPTDQVVVQKGLGDFYTYLSEDIGCQVDLANSSFIRLMSCILLNPHRKGLAFQKVQWLSEESVTLLLQFLFAAFCWLWVHFFYWGVLFKEFILYSLDDMIFLILICTAFIQKNEMIMTSRVFLCAKVSLSCSEDSK